jgi:exo-beta-1,3-glucanase (GH17 family)
MSSKPASIQALKGIDLAGKSQAEQHTLFTNVLQNGMHGLCFSAYEEGQEPGSILSPEQVRRRLSIIAPHIKAVRTFSCIEGNELIASIAKEEFGLQTLVGAWLGKDKDLNEEEIEGLIQLAKDGHVDIAAVGNEVLYRNDLPAEELLGHIQRVKKAIPNVPVGYVDAYYEFSVHPAITEACDVILANCYPYWEGCHIDYSLIHIKQMYYQALAAGQGKQVIISETGWPSQGTGLNEAQPGYENALRYFLNIQQWVEDEGIESFYFSSFDEAWKTGDEGDVGAYWGLWDKDEQLKY